ncbi:MULTISPECIES: hypothetical protein [unclassified Microbacterium]|uniref:hypothetical protein n=1 Tax=unclassified Microbacterium TaxID=2609290 RepID=UPI003018BA94
MNETTETTEAVTIAPGVYHDRDGDVWAVLLDQTAVALADHAEGAPTYQEFARMAFVPVDAAALAADFGPLTAIHLFPEAQA